jgi:hypothetical protein
MCRSSDYEQESRRKCQMCTGLEPFSVGKFALHRDTIPGSESNFCIYIVLNVGPCNMGEGEGEGIDWNLSCHKQILGPWI